MGTETCRDSLITDNDRYSSPITIILYGRTRNILPLSGHSRNERWLKKPIQVGQYIYIRSRLCQRDQCK